MDRDWLKADRRSREFQNRVEELLLFAFENGYDENKISCPCLKCAHSKSWKARIVRDHLFQNGIDQTYKCWIWHGEVDMGQSQAAAEVTGSSESVDQMPMRERKIWMVMMIPWTPQIFLTMFNLNMNPFIRDVKDLLK